MADTFVEPADGFPEWAPIEHPEEEDDRLAVIIDMASGELRGVTEALGTGQITVEEWIDQITEIIFIYHMAAWMTGSDNIDPTDEELATIADFLADEMAYLGGFRDALLAEPADIELPGKYRPRIDQYALAVRVAFFIGYAYGFGVNLPFQPGERTQCHRQCKCYWSIDEIDPVAGDYDATWHLGIADHCETCVARAFGCNPLEVRGGIWNSNQITADMYA